MTQKRTERPRFKEFDAVYYADNCAPLVRAVETGQISMHALARSHYPGTKLQQTEAVGLQTVGFWDASSDQTWGLDWHRNEGIEITYLARGRLGFSVDDNEWTLEPNQITITRPWQRHRVGNPNISPSRLHWCIIDVDVRHPNQTWRWPEWLCLSKHDLARLTDLLQLNEQPVWPASQQIHGVFEKLADCVSNARSHTPESRLRLLANELLLATLELLETHKPELNRDLTSTRRGVGVFLNDLKGCLDQNWTLDDMAQSCGLGRSQFSRYCQEITNMSPIKYINHLRIDSASEMLALNSRRSITDIAFDCGFSSSQYFSSMFFRHKNLSPRQYRDLHRTGAYSVSRKSVQRFCDNS